MTDAPERIHLDGDVDSDDSYFTRCFVDPKYCSEPAIAYIRADLHDVQLAALREENRELAMQIIASDEQAHDAYSETLALRDRVEAMQEALTTREALIGALEYHEGRSEDDNPYPARSEKRLWQLGWEAARAALKADQ